MNAAEQHNALRIMDVDVWRLRDDGRVLYGGAVGAVDEVDDDGVDTVDEQVVVGKVAGDGVSGDASTSVDASDQVAVGKVAGDGVSGGANASVDASDQVVTDKVAGDGESVDASASDAVSDDASDDAGIVAEPPADETLDIIRQQVAQCTQCALHQSRKQTVFGVGDARADWLFVGEAPGREEDLQGEPFVGRAGKLLDLMLAALGMSREAVFIANVLKCRPPENRDPTAEEVALCENYLHRQLAIIQPKIIVALGRISAQALLKTDQPLAKLRGATHAYGRADTPLVVTYHPAYLLRSPGQKEKAWEDLWRAKMIVDES